MNSKFKDIKLKIEMVPEPLWNTNLRYLLKPKKWQEIRKIELKRTQNDKYQFCCEICTRAKDSLDCHEIWVYDDVNHIQTLEGLIMLCKQCHLIKHIGFSSNLAMEGKCNFNGLIQHFCYLNKLTPEDFYNHYLEEYGKWEERGKHEWTQNLNFITNYKVALF